MNFSDAMDNIKGQYNQALKAWDELPDNWSKSKKDKKDFADTCVKIEKFNFK